MENNPIIQCQTTSANPRWQKWFQVRVPTEPALTGKELCPMAQSIGDKIFSRDKFVKFTSAKRSDREKSNFVSMSEIEEKMDEYQMNFDDVARIAFGKIERNSDADHCLRCVVPTLETMYCEAREIGCHSNRFRCFRRDIATPGTVEKKKEFRFCTKDEVGARTAKSYAHSSSLAVKVAVVISLTPEICAKFILGPEVKQAVEAYIDYCVSRKEDLSACDMKYVELLHRLLFASFFEKGSYVEGKHMLYCDILYICLCCSVQETPGCPGRSDESNYSVRLPYTNSELDDSGRLKKSSGGTEFLPISNRLRYSTARRTGSELSGLMYSISCLAILEIFKYSEDLEKEKKYYETRQALQPGSLYGLTILVEPRTLCSHLRLSEVRITKFVPCTDDNHGLCGTTDSHHKSAVQIGNSVRLLHERIRKKLHCSFMRQYPVFHNFKEGLNRLHDDVDNLSVGYNVFCEEQNIKFMQMCMNWINTFCKAEERYIRSKEFIEDVKELQKMIITAIHLTGGAPERGTELASLLVRSTKSSRRSVYFLPNELLVVPQFDKRRGMLGGSVKFISRHTDSETSYLYKKFFVLIRPIAEYVIGRNTTDKVEQIKIFENISMNLINPSDMSRCIRQVFYQIGVDMKYITWRHHNTGLMKEKCRRLANPAIAFLLNSNNNEYDNGEEEEECGLENSDELGKVCIEQGSHSIRTANYCYAQSKGLDRLILLSTMMDKVELHRIASQEWHAEMGLSLKEERSSERIVQDRRSYQDCTAAVARLQEMVVDLAEEVRSIREGILEGGEKRRENVVEGRKEVRNSASKKTSGHPGGAPEDSDFHNRQTEGGLEGIVRRPRVFNGSINRSGIENETERKWKRNLFTLESEEKVFMAITQREMTMWLLEGVLQKM